MSVPTPPSPRSPGKMFLVLHTHSYSFYTIDTTVFRRLGLLCPEALLSRSAWKFKSVQSCPWPMTDHSTRLKAQNASSMWYKLCKAINTPDHREASGWWEGFLWNCIQVCLFSFSDFLSPYQYFNKSHMKFAAQRNPNEDPLCSLCSKHSDVLALSWTCQYASGTYRCFSFCLEFCVPTCWHGSLLYFLQVFAPISHNQGSLPWQPYILTLLRMYLFPLYHPILHNIHLHLAYYILMQANWLYSAWGCRSQVEYQLCFHSLAALQHPVECPGP